jgi:RNA polymerase sigma factor (sigma-70 family)
MELIIYSTNITLLSELKNFLSHFNLIGVLIYEGVNNRSAKMRTEDGNIILECINGDSASFGLLVDKYKASIFALAYSRLNNFQDAEDITQEVFLKAYTSLRTLRNWDNFVVWLRSVTINLCKNKIREQTRRRDNVPIKDQDMEALENASLDSYQEEQFLSWRNEALDSLDKALDSLPEQYRQILTLHYLGGMKGEEISKFLSISHDTVRQRLSRARAMLKEEVLAMISTDYEQRKLSASFTFRIVEAVKKIRINPPSVIKGLPWGLSVGAGFLMIILSLGSHIQINLPDIAMGLPMPSDMKILKVGEIPVDAINVSTMTFIGNKGDGKGIAPDPKGQENAFFMSPQGEGKWEKKADMPTGRSSPCASEVNGKIYVIGGTLAGGNISLTEEYDPKLDKWTQKSNMLIPRTQGTTTTLNGRIYAIGGLGRGTLPLSAVEEYEAKTPMPSPKFFHSAVAINNKIYVLEGDSALDNNGIGIASFSVYVYDPAIDQWKQLKDIPDKYHTEASSAIAVDNKIYFFGGYHISTFSMHKNVLVYDTVTETWEIKSELLTKRLVSAAERIGDKIYVIGGTDFNGFIGFSNVEEYSIKTDKWEKKVDMLTARGYLASSVSDGKIFVFGGTTAFPAWPPKDFLATNEVYIPDTDTIKSVDPSGKLPKTWGTLKAK